MKISNHPANLDRTAVLVWNCKGPETFISVYRTSGGFVACKPVAECIPGYFETQEQAVEALTAEGLI